MRFDKHNNSNDKKNKQTNAYQRKYNRQNLFCTRRKSFVGHKSNREGKKTFGKYIKNNFDQKIHKEIHCSTALLSLV